MLDFTTVYQPKISESSDGAALKTKNATFKSLRLGAGLDVVSDAIAFSKSSTYELGASSKFSFELLDKAGTFKAMFKNSNGSYFDQEVLYNAKRYVDLAVFANFNMDKVHNFSAKASSTIFNDGRKSYSATFMYDRKF